MALIVHQVALELIEELVPLMPRIARHDKNLALQLRRCASSVVLNIGEGESSDPGTKRARFYSAAGSAGEVRSALELATAWGYVAKEQTRVSLALADRVVRMLWGLTH